VAGGDGAVWVGLTHLARQKEEEKKPTFVWLHLEIAKVVLKRGAQIHEPSVLRKIHQRLFV